MYILDTCKVNEFRKTLMAAMDKIDELEQKERISFPSPYLNQMRFTIFLVYFKTITPLYTWVAPCIYALCKTYVIHIYLRLF